jgi:CheY-specific phosphatase CheX
VPQASLSIADETTVNIVNIMNTAERMNSINRLLASALQEYRLRTVVGVIVYDDLRRPWYRPMSTA